MPRSIEEDAEAAEPWEHRVGDDLAGLSFPKVRRLQYGKNRFETQYQRRGIDGIITQERVTWDAKVRSHQYYGGDICLELYHAPIDAGDPFPGWLYKCEADCVAYAWRDAADKNFMPDAYLLMLKHPEFQQWVKTMIGEFDQVKSQQWAGQYKIIRNRDYSRNKTGQRWWTYNIYVAIEDFPLNVLHRYEPSRVITDKQLDLFMQYESAKPIFKPKPLPSNPTLFDFTENF